MKLKRQTLAEQIAAMEPSNDCVLWEGCTTKEGYPLLYYRGRLQSGHRVSYQLHIGPIPKKHWVVRTCRNLLCLNPKHLELQKAGNPIRSSSSSVSSDPKIEEASLPPVIEPIAPDKETPSAPVIDSIVYDKATSAWHAFYWENKKMVKYGVFDEYNRAAYALTDYLKESA